MQRALLLPIHHQTVVSAEAIKNKVPLVCILELREVRILTRTIYKSWPPAAALINFNVAYVLRRLRRLFDLIKLQHSCDLLVFFSMHSYMCCCVLICVTVNIFILTPTRDFRLDSLHTLILSAHTPSETQTGLQHWLNLSSFTPVWIGYQHCI